MIKEQPIHGPLSFSCGDTLPEFTLGVETKLTDTQLKTLCTCLADNLDERARETGKALGYKNSKEIAPQEFLHFSNQFGTSMKTCGAFNL
jgi:hypothetical protein